MPVERETLFRVSLVLILVFAAAPFTGKRFWNRPDLRYAYVFTPLRLVLKLNFPLVVLLLTVAYPIGVATSDTSGVVLRAVTSGVYDLAILTSTAAFWYFVVEVEMGKRRARCLRFSGRPIERLKATVMILVGVGAAVFAVWDGHRLVVLDRIN